MGLAPRTFPPAPGSLDRLWTLRRETRGVGAREREAAPCPLSLALHQGLGRGSALGVQCRGPGLWRWLKTALPAVEGDLCLELRAAPRKKGPGRLMLSPFPLPPLPTTPTCVWGLGPKTLRTLLLQHSCHVYLLITYCLSSSLQGAGIQ